MRRRNGQKNRNRDAVQRSEQRSAWTGQVSHRQPRNDSKTAEQPAIEGPVYQSVVAISHRRSVVLSDRRGYGSSDRKPPSVDGTQKWTTR